MIALLNKLNAAPDKWLGSSSIPGLKCFLCGFNIGAQAAGADLGVIGTFWRGFDQRLGRIFGERRSGLDLIYVNSANDGEAWRKYSKEFKTYVKTLDITFIRALARKYRISKNSVEMSGFLEVIEHRPGMFLWPVSLSSLYIWVKGFHAGVNNFAANRIPVVPEFQRFESWLTKQEQIRFRSRWDRILLSQSGFCEELALKAFSCSCDDFRHLNVKIDSLPRVVDLRHFSRIESKN